MPVTVENETIDRGYSSSLVKFIITRDFICKSKGAIRSYIHNVLSHVKSPRTLHIHITYDC